MGSEVKLQEEAPVVTLKASELVTYEEPIDFETVERNLQQDLRRRKRSQAKGEKGTKVITARVEKSNGKESTKVPIVEKVEKEPTTEVILVGTKERPPTIGSGKYIYPVTNYRISSPFGARWGRNHNGVDLACAMGSDVVAADGGTVTGPDIKAALDTWSSSTTRTEWRPIMDITPNFWSRKAIRSTRDITSRSPGAPEGALALIVTLKFVSMEIRSIR